MGPKMNDQIELFTSSDYHPTDKQVLTTHGDFLHGIHQGENVHEVGISYLRRVLRDHIYEADREVIEQVIRLRTEA
jgi:hypothetical protein